MVSALWVIARHDHPDGPNLLQHDARMHLPCERSRLFSFPQRPTFLKPKTHLLLDFNIPYIIYNILNLKNHPPPPLIKKKKPNQTGSSSHKANFLLGSTMNHVLDFTESSKWPIGALDVLANLERPDGSGFLLPQEVKRRAVPRVTAADAWCMLDGCFGVFFWRVVGLVLVGV